MWEICCAFSMQGLERWETSDLPYTSHALPPSAQAFHSSACSGAPFMGCIAAAKRGLIIIGQMARAEDAAAALKIAEALGWPVAADVLSGIPTSSAYWVHDHQRQYRALSCLKICPSGQCHLLLSVQEGHACSQRGVRAHEPHSALYRPVPCRTCMM